MQIPSNPIFTRADAAMMAVYNRFADHLLSPPEFIYHYTSLPAAHMILKNKELWLTNAVTMNDPSEVRYAHQILVNIDKKRSPTRNQSKYIDLVFSLLGNAADQCYLSSFSSISNSLSQWRSYSNHPQGVCLAFSAAALSEMAPDSQLVKVVYKENCRKRFLQPFLTNCRLN
jgi:hypothetical protein